MSTKIMKLFAVALVLNLFAISCDCSKRSETTIEGGLKFCESTYSYNGGVLIANFGAEALNPLNNEGKGYISYFKDGDVSVFIDADTNLSAPKGMFEKDGYLYICDVNKIVVYNLNSINEAPKTVLFPEGELFVNDIAYSDGSIFVSVTNTGNIYKIGINNPATIELSAPQLWANVIGANGLLVDNGKMYVASYPANGVTTEDNVVYIIDDIATPQPQKLIQASGQYDGLAISEDKELLYVSNWSPAGVIAVNLSTKEIEPVSTLAELVGPADISVVNGALFIPDLPNSRVVVVPILE